MMDHIRELGVLALGSRLKRLSDRFMADGARFYREASVDFQPKWFPLFTLVRGRPGITLSEAAEALGQSHAAISQAAEAMVKAGLFIREECAQDGRSKLLSLSAKAETMLPQLDQLWQVVLAANQVIQQESGADMLQAIERMEEALDRQSFYERLGREHKAQAYEAIEIIPYAPEYKKYVGILNAEWLEKYFRVEDRDQQMFDDPEGHMLVRGGAIFFARVDGQIVGTCSFYRHPDGMAELVRLGVREAYHGRQIARKLSERVIEEARRQGVEDIYITTNSALVPALTLYRKLGFVIEDNPYLISKYERADTVLRLDLREVGARAEAA